MGCYVSEVEECLDAFHGVGLFLGRCGTVGRVGFDVVFVGFPLVEWRPADFFEEFDGETGCKDGEFVFVLAGEAVLFVHQAGLLGFVPEEHSGRCGEFRRQVGGRDSYRVFFFWDDWGLGLLVGAGFGLVFLDEVGWEAAADEHIGTVVGGMDVVDECLDFEAFFEEGEIDMGQGVLDGGKGDVCEDGTEGFGEAPEPAEELFEGG